MGKFRIIVEVEGGSHRITVTDDAGNEKECNSVLVIGGNETTKELYLFAWGHPATVAWAIGEGLSNAQCDPWYEAFIGCHCRDMALRTMPIGIPTTADKLCTRWAEEDSAAEINMKKFSH